MMKLPWQWLREWLGLNQSYLEFKDELDKGGGITLTYHFPDENAVRRRKKLIAIAKNPWTTALTCVVLAAFLSPLVAKLF